MANIELTQQLVKELFDYKDGKLFWKNKISNKSRIKIGSRAGSICNFKGSIRCYLYLNGKRTNASRIIFLWHEGWLPEMVDHEDRNTSNDRIENLRAADKYKNQHNTTGRPNFTSVYKGVSWVKSRNKWLASIHAENKHITIGRFINELDAVLAYNREAVRYYKEFAYLNIFKP